MKIVKEAYVSGERALFNSKDITIERSIFAQGESPLKESQNIEIIESIFKWKYPLWYCKNVKVFNTTLLETARSGIWYTDHIEMINCTLDSPKTFRRSSDIVLTNVHMANAQETLWNCNDIELRNVHAQGDYFGMNSSDIYVDHLNLTGNYSFDGGKNIEVHNSVLLSKDAFWNCENVVVYDSTIIGEYLGWNSKNITFINCTIESLQGLCYIENLKMVNCKLMNTSLAFEYCTLDVSITSHIDSIKNPISGSIQASSIGEVILEEDKIDPSLTKIQYLQHPILESSNRQTSCVC
ncbi:DUF3737 family protein [Amedibacillus sp. YH-ame10]